MVPSLPGGSAISATRTATRPEIRPLSRVLARAFHDDPVHRWMFPGESDWKRYSHRAFAMVMKLELPHRGVFTDQSQRGAAIWRDSAIGPPTRWQQTWSGALMVAMLGRRVREVAAAFGRLMKQHPREPHWYLSVLGTDPKHQRAGVGSAVLRPALERCDATGRLAYLEASRIENVPYYERHGFEVLGETSLGGGPVVWRMARRPRPSAGG